MLEFKTDDDTECQLVHTLAHAIVFPNHCMNLNMNVKLRVRRNGVRELEMCPWQRHLSRER